MEAYITHPLSGFARKIWLSLAIMAIVAIHTQAQQLYKIGSETTMTIDGTSTIHDWSSAVKHVYGEGKFTLEGNTITAISDLKVNMVVKSIKSGKGTLMDNNTYKALKAEKYPEIIYELQSLQVLPNQKLNTTGKLTIGGMTKTIKMLAGYQINAGKISIQGEMPILLREYNIDPPTAMMGTIKTGEEVKVIFNTVFTSAKQLSNL
jgi:polyisoprenoid-binding protein YceI